MRLTFLVLLLATQAQADLQFADRAPPGSGELKPTGDQVLLSVHGEKDAKIDPLFFKKVDDRAMTWLTGRGYKRVHEIKKAHVMIDIAVRRAPDPKGEKQELTIQAYSNENGRQPLIATNQVYWENRANVKFLDDDKLVFKTVDKLLSASIVGKVDKAPAPTNPEDPGCWYVLGIAFEMKPLKDKLYIISGFANGSPAEQVGLKPLDQVIEIDGKPMKDRFPPKFKKGDAPKLTYIRNSEKKTVAVPVKYQCSEGKQELKS